jgi:hypothetical protein
MARVPLPESRIRARRRRQRSVFAVTGLVLFLIVFGGLVWLSRASFLSITNIEVSGEYTISAASVQDIVQSRLAGSYGHLFAKNNIFLYPKSQLEATLLASMPVIASVEVRTVDFHTIAVSIIERQPKALWCGDSVEASSSSCLLLDQNGLAYAPAVTFSGDAYKQYYGALLGNSTPLQYLTPAAFASLSALVDTLAQNQPQDMLVSVSVDQNSDVHVGFASGFTLLFPLSADGGDVYNRFILALQSDPFKGHTIADFEYLDLRFGDRLYYKLKQQ